MSVYFRALLDEAVIRTKVNKFLSEKFFITEEKDIFKGVKIRVDVVRGSTEYAVTVKRGTGGRENTMERWVGNTFTPPSYHETTPITGESLDIVDPGVSQYDLSQNYMDSLSRSCLEAAAGMTDKIERALELLCRDALFFGKIVLYNGDEIDFEVKTNHFYTTPVAWTNDAADPFADFGNIGDIVRTDSGRPIMDAICGSTAIQKFKNNKIVKESAVFVQMKRMDLTSPIADPESGAIYHGTINADDYKINLWTFPESVKVPIGFGLPNEGTKVKVIPDDRICTIPEKPNFRLYYAGNTIMQSLDESLKNKLGISAGPQMRAGKMLRYAYADTPREAVIVGVKSSPMPILVDKEELGVIIVS